MMKKVEWHPATEKEWRYIAERLRKDDMLEISAEGVEPLGAVFGSANMSDECFIGTIDGEIAMAFGYGERLISFGVGDIWGLGTDVCTSSPREMLVYGREIVRSFLEKVPVLCAYCDARYTKALNWLRHIGFTVHPPQEYGKNKEMFCLCEIKQED